MLTSAVAAPGFSHSHAGGDASHSHSAHAAEAGHAHDHADHRHHRHEVQALEASDAAVVMAPSTRHAHLCVLGFDFALPPSEDSEQGDQHAEFLALPGQGSLPVLIVTRHLPGVDLLLQNLEATAPDCSVSSDLFARSGRAQVLALPLCDGARFERSGVLLI